MRYLAAAALCGIAIAPAKADVSWSYVEESLVNRLGEPIWGFQPGRIGATLTVSNADFFSGSIHVENPCPFVCEQSTGFTFTVPASGFGDLNLPGFYHSNSFSGGTQSLSFQFDTAGHLSGGVHELAEYDWLSLGTVSGSIATDSFAFGCPNAQCNFTGHWDLTTPLPEEETAFALLTARPAAVPEPSSLAIILAALLSLFVFRRVWQ